MEELVTEDLLAMAVEALEDIKGQDINVLDVKKLTSMTDYMVIATGQSNRQVKALANSVVVSSKEKGLQPLGIEGEEKGEWVLIDLGDVVVHVMQAAIRDFYQLEKLWQLPDPEE